MENAPNASVSLNAKHSSFLKPLFLYLLSPAALILLLALTCLDLFSPKPAQNESKHLLTELFYSTRLMQRPSNFMCLSVIQIFLSASIQWCTFFYLALWHRWALR